MKVEIKVQACCNSVAIELEFPMDIQVQAVRKVVRRINGKPCPIHDGTLQMTMEVKE
jgi:hypothetical protein